MAGSGLSDDKFLPFLPQLTGDRDVQKSSSSSGKHGGSVYANPSWMWQIWLPCHGDERY
ncbi:hypothetical protein ACFY5D_09290 [Paeniglutamicibacter sp. NPDC012692]|uniref:hypothetical protein n=1 Tax=Paeniglutamicibacter sp. NPDC012692 TaxID=3364388 RepID=UPI0036B12E32